MESSACRSADRNSARRPPDSFHLPLEELWSMGRTGLSGNRRVTLRPLSGDPARISLLITSIRGTMRILYLFVMVVLMNVPTTSQTLPAPQAITDPKQIASRPDA